MAETRLALKENAERRFFVDETCIYCELCKEVAPSVFGEHDDGYAYVVRQPTSQEEVERVYEALEACPTESIGDSESITKEPVQEKKPLNFGIVLLISFILFNLGFLVDFAAGWSNFFLGLTSGLFYLIFFSFAWGLVILPWSVVILALHDRFKWQRFRTQWALAPAVLMLIYTIGGLIVEPQTPSQRFNKFAHTELPHNVQDLHYSFSGGGITDYTDIYYFETTPEEVDRLISEMQLEVDMSSKRNGVIDGAIPTLDGAPDYSTWQGTQQYQGWARWWGVVLLPHHR